MGMSVHKNENWIALLFNYTTLAHFISPGLMCQHEGLGEVRWHFISEPLAWETKDKCFGLIRHLMINIESWLLIDV